jgi:hypothetical protein
LSKNHFSFEKNFFDEKCDRIKDNDTDGNAKSEVKLDA